ncbi:thrombospondin type 3 repeat-containing protein [Maribacter ulvicola]|uniref:Thrombospondin type 3 repeat-containing protein n=1 Tax=Maribacter ulvicola TaxID=228959 RepID=A0A1N6ZXZ5_9FLAO|nr:thrombospondin type 3 repeat-containing protein [Maribacter ulvicola]SIR31742.1 Thrombospondin type 3 repeat-containing protein [Maribacter ulvicola]
MKKIIFIHVFLFLFIPLAFSQTILNVEDFEGTDFVGYAIGNADTGTDYSSQNFIVSGPDRISRGTVGSFTFDGSITGNATNFIGGEDINFTTDGGFYNGHSYIELDPIDITSKSNLSIDIDVAFPNTSPTRYEINDFFIVDYKIDGGSYTTVLAFYGDGDTPTPTLGLRRDDNLNGILDIGEVSIVNTAMTSFNLNLDAITGSAVSGNSIEIRVRFKMPDSQEEFAFDNIILKGSIGNTAPVIGGISIGQLVDDNSTIAPFSAITTTDADGDNLSATITLDDNLKGTLTGTGLSGSGPYTIASTTPADLQSKLRALTFNPTDNRTTTIETTTFSVVINDGTDTDTNNTTTVISNAVAPTVTSVDVPANATYLVGQDLDFTINFSENVTVNTTVGTPQIAITIGATVRQATYVSGSGTNALVYRYTIQLGDLDINGITVGILVANGGTLRDSGGEDAILTLLNIGLTTAVLVDANIPILTSVNVPANATYITGQNLDFTVNFNDNIIVNTSVGTPQLAIIIGATTRQATYISGSGTNALVFRYTVQTGDLDTNGIAVIALSANGGTLKNAGNNDANLTLIGVGLTGGVLVDAVAPIVTSVTVPANATYITGQNLDFTVNLSKNTIVNTTLGTPQLAITVGATTRQASYISGSGTSSLLFSYTVQAGDLDTDGIAVGTLSANGGTLLDLVNNIVDLTLNSVGTTVGVLVDAIAPIVTSVTVPANATYITGQNLDFTVNLSENTIVNTTLGTPQLAITVGATTRQASYISGSGTTALLFRYTVQAGDLDTDGIAVGTLSANGGTLLDLVNNVVDLTLNSVGTTVGVLVDAIAPIVTSVTVPANATYITGQNLDFTVNLSENTIVNTTLGTPQLAITVGATTRQASYISGSGTTALLFRYTIQTGELDSDGITIASLSANGGTLQDNATNDLNTVLNNVGSTSSILVDALAPTGYSVDLDYNPINDTNEDAISFSFSGAEVGSTYNYTINSSGGGTNVTGSGTINMMNDQITGIDLSALSDGTITLSFSLTDAYNNIGNTVTDTAIKGTDSDNDGIADSLDNCPSTSNTDQIDTDNDGKGDMCDTDDDNDGTLDSEDAFPLDNTENTDTDGDGTGDNADTDDDNDGTLDSEDAFPLDNTEDTDTDGDGTGDNADTDDDNDGTLDSEDAFPLDNTEDTDTDGDGTGDNADTDDDNDGTLDSEDAFPLDNTEDTDTDGDGTGDNADTDDDNDGTLDSEDAFPLDNTEDTDTDGDGTGDNADTDDDNDGTLDSEDAFPLDNAEDTDTDGDGTGDNADTDDDNDGTLDSEDAFPLDPTEDKDSDNDGIGDNSDTDSDSDIKEGNPEPAQAFTPNGDGINDTWLIPGINKYPNNLVKV